MTSSWLIRVLYVAILTGSVERVRTDSAISLSPANRKQSDANSDSDAIAGKPVSASSSSDDDEVIDTDNSAAAADKRKWGEKTMLTWGKRSSAAPSAQHSPLSRKLCAEERLLAASRDRRRWGEKSMSVWGKRSPADMTVGSGCDDDTQIGTAAVGRVDRRKWGEKTMQVWGKRLAAAEMSDDENEEASGGTDKRKWGEKSMSAWGKRLSEEAEKRKWGSNSMTVWGKREFPSQLTPGHEREQEIRDDSSLQLLNKEADAENNDAEDYNTEIFDKIPPSTRSTSSIATGGRLRWSSRRHGGTYWGPKRKWETNTMKVWGKRASAKSDWRGIRTIEHD